MKLSKLFSSLSIAVASCLFTSASMAQNKSFIVHIPAPTVNNKLLSYEYYSVKQLDSDYVEFVYYVSDSFNRPISNVGVVSCGTRDGWRITENKRGLFGRYTIVKKIKANSVGAVFMLRMVCGQVYPHWFPDVDKFPKPDDIVLNDEQDS
ncbi:hypothetical protein ELBI_82 [Anabaena phage Elbi]|nr:hypothetical protein ELBI_82 [Anabaena phage Elbi]